MKSLGFLIAIAVGFGIAGGLWVYGTRTELLSMHNDLGEGFVRAGEAHRQLEAVLPDFLQGLKRAGIAQAAVAEVEQANARVNSVKLHERLPEEPENFKRFDRFQADLLLAVGRLVKVTEKDPALRASKELVGQRADVENAQQKAVSIRRDYNEFLLQYNTTLERFPGTTVGPKEGLKPFLYFTADPSGKDGSTAHP